jgi:hypothetical protein
MPSLTTLTIRAATRIDRWRADIATRYQRLMEEPEAGVEQIPWTMIMMIGGAVIAVGIVTAIVAFVHAQLAQLPANPGF